VPITQATLAPQLSPLEREALHALYAVTHAPEPPPQVQYHPGGCVLV
jgi:hypothetical protein